MGSPQIEGGQEVEQLLPSQSKPTCTPHQSPVGLPPGKSLFSSELYVLDMHHLQGSKSHREDLPMETYEQRRATAVVRRVGGGPILQPARCTGPQGADTTSAPTLEWHRISWPRSRIEVWERAIAGAHVGVGLRVHLLPDEQQAHDFVEVGLRDQTGLLKVIQAHRRPSGCYTVGLPIIATTAERQGDRNLPVAARVTSPDGQLLCMALLDLPGTVFWITLKPARLSLYAKTPTALSNRRSLGFSASAMKWSANRRGDLNCYAHLLVGNCWFPSIETQFLLLLPLAQRKNKVLSVKSCRLIFDDCRPHPRRVRAARGWPHLRHHMAGGGDLALHGDCYRLRW
jgi:hypothetical protein